MKTVNLILAKCPMFFQNKVYSAGTRDIQVSHTMAVKLFTDKHGNVNQEELRDALVNKDDLYTFDEVILAGRSRNTKHEMQELAELANHLKTFVALQKLSSLMSLSEDIAAPI